MPVWSIVLLVIIAILVVALIALIIVGNKLRKKQTENQAQIDAAKQIIVYVDYRQEENET